jgi:antitoxin component YwqK of YwqJK toxin-antitoxin module
MNTVKTSTVRTTKELSVIQQYFGDKIVSETYRYDNKTHNDVGPAFRGWHPNGTISREEYYQYGVKNREGGPAITHYNEDGSVILQSYYKDNMLHRLDGPAFVRWYSDSGELALKEFYINGREISEEDLHKRNAVKPLEGKTMVIDGVEYKLVRVD